MKRSLKQIFSKCVKDEAYRAEMTLYLNLAINLCYAVFKAVCGIFFHSAWIGTLAFYYILLSIMRLSLAKGMSILMQKGKEGISYPGYLIYGVAAYTFYAVVTVFSLQSAMLNTFGDDPGFVVKIGKDVTDFTVGERVYPYPRYAKNDTKRAGTIGGFSEYILVPEAKRMHSLYPVDERISDKLASLIEPFTVGCRAARRGMIPAGTGADAGKMVYVKGQNAVVFGAGTIGIAAAVAFKYFGMDKVMVCDVLDYRLSLAENLGFEICNMEKLDFSEKSKSVFGTAFSLMGETADIDCWLDAAGAESILRRFMEFGKIESRFVSVAVNNTMKELDLLHLTYSKKSIIGSGGYMPMDVWDVQEIMASGRWKLESIITHEFGIDDLEKAIKTSGNADKVGNVVIHF